jgi:uncharacterized membrane protein
MFCLLDWLRSCILLASLLLACLLACSLAWLADVLFGWLVPQLHFTSLTLVACLLEWWLALLVGWLVG